MKLFATLLSIILTSVSFSQSENLVQYQIDANTNVTAIDVIAHIDQADKNQLVGKIESIHHSTINLLLSERIDYTVIINEGIVMEIKSADIADYVAQENTAYNNAKNETE